MASDWNTLMETLAKTGLGEHEQRVLAAVARKTLGYRQRADRLPVSQIVELTGLDSRHVSRALAQLAGRGLIARTGGSKGHGNAATISIIVAPENPPQEAGKKPAPQGTKTHAKKLPLGDHKTRLTRRTQGVQGVKNSAQGADDDLRRKAFETYLAAGGSLTLDRERGALARSLKAAVLAGTEPELILAAVRDLGRKQEFPGLLKQRLVEFAENGIPCRWAGIGRLHLTSPQLLECGCRHCEARADKLRAEFEHAGRQ